MKRRHIATISAAMAGFLLLSACTGNRRVSGTASTPTSTVASDTGVPNSGAPKVQNPLPTKVLEGSPCDSALTSTQIATFLGKPEQPEPSTDQLGASCDWSNVEAGAGFTVGYQTKSDQGISLAYKSVKPSAKRWVELESVQEYPAIGYAGTELVPGQNKNCVVVVGVSDELAYSVSLVIGDAGAKAGKDACKIGRDIADAVMTNLRQRA